MIKELMIFFAANPDAKLTTAQLADKYDAERNTMAGRLQPHVESGYLAVVAPGASHRPAIYTAGPRLLKARA